MKHREESYRLAESPPGDYPTHLYPRCRCVLLIDSVSFLVGRGAHEWAVSHGITPCPSEKMATSKFAPQIHAQNPMQQFENTVFKHKKKRKTILMKVWRRFLTGNIRSPPEFSLSAYKRNKRKMELAEKMESGHNQIKKRRQSTETVSPVAP